MSDTTDATPWHESIQAFRARGGQPADHPACALLTEVAGRIRWVAPDRERAAAEEWLARTPRSATDRRLDVDDLAVGADRNVRTRAPAPARHPRRGCRGR